MNLQYCKKQGRQEETEKTPPLKWKELYDKAEELYKKGEFERALVFYHRGRRLRPNFEQFYSGIVKCSDAIENNCEKENDTKGTGGMKERREQRFAGRKTTRARNDSRRMKDIAVKHDIKHTRQLEGTKTYMAELLDEIDGSLMNGKEIRRLAQKTIDYIDTRSGFWRQLMPAYALRQLDAPPPPPGTTPQSPYHYVLKQLNRIANDFSEGRFEACLEKAHRCRRTVKGYSEKELVSKHEVMANIFTYMGNAHFELADYKNALYFHQEDLKLGKAKKITVAKMHAMENIGRVYARTGKFDKALSIWQEKLPLCTIPMEKAWLYHEMGYCYLSQADYTKALNYGETSYEQAVTGGDLRWQLNASTLTAQAQALDGDPRSAVDTFQRARDLANLLGDEEGVSTIAMALIDLNKAIVSSIQGTSQAATSSATRSVSMTTKNDNNETVDEDDVKSVRSGQSRESDAAETGQNHKDNEIDKSDGESDQNEADSVSVTLSLSTKED